MSFASSRSRGALFAAPAALDRGESELARSRFQLLLTGNPTPEVRRLIEDAQERLQLLNLFSQTRLTITLIPPDSVDLHAAITDTLQVNDASAIAVHLPIVGVPDRTTHPRPGSGAYACHGRRATMPP